MIDGEVRRLVPDDLGVSIPTGQDRQVRHQISSHANLILTVDLPFPR